MIPNTFRNFRLGRRTGWKGYVLTVSETRCKKKEGRLYDSGRSRVHKTYVLIYKGSYTLFERGRVGRIGIHLKWRSLFDDTHTKDF